MAAPVASTEKGFYNVTVEEKAHDLHTSESISYFDMVNKVRKVFNSGKTKNLEWRRSQLQAMQRLVLENHERICEAIQKDHGGPKVRALSENSGWRAADIMLQNLDEWSAPEVVSHSEGLVMGFNGKSYIRKEPKGVVLLISPWNFPFNLTFEGLVPIIAAGNCCIVKPSEVSVHSCALMAELIPKYFDNEAIKVVTGGVPETTALLREKYDHIMYTGNGAVGRIVMGAAARHLTPVTLELGGKSPTYVDKSAKLDTAIARILMAKTLNAGQICIAPDYILVHSDVAAEFKTKLVAELQKQYGSTSDQRKNNKDFGRIINSRHVGRINSLVEETTGEILVGGASDPHARFMDPTVIANPGMNDTVMTEEIFGPVLPIIEVRDVHEAAERVNSICDHPLALYIYSEDQNTTETFLNNTTSGGVCVNSCVEHIGDNNLPFGGVGESGMGAYHGKTGFMEFSHKRSVLVKDTTFNKGPLLPPPPYSDKLYDVAFKLTIGGIFTDKQRQMLKMAGGAAAALVAYRVLKSKL